jgi:hypothetical protein
VFDKRISRKILIMAFFLWPLRFGASNIKHKHAKLTLKENGSK